MSVPVNQTSEIDISSVVSRDSRLLGESAQTQDGQPPKVTLKSGLSASNATMTNGTSTNRRPAFSMPVEDVTPRSDTMPPDGPLQSFAPFFLVGCPRSGTTVLQAILNRHPSVCVPPETKLFAHFYRMPRSIRLRCVTRIERDLGISLSDLPGQGADLSTDQLLIHSFGRFRDLIDRPDVRLIGEKTPEHTAYLPEISEQFPSARFVAIVRNGYHVAESLNRMPWLHCDLRAGGAIWAFYVRQLEAMIRSHPDRFCVVRFEELVEQPTTTTSTILEFLGVEPDHASDCLEPNSQFDQHLFPTREGRWKDNALGRLNEVQSRPKRTLDDRQRRQVEDGCYECLERWGYLETDVLASDRARSTDVRSGERHPLNHTEKPGSRQKISRMRRYVGRVLVYLSLLRTASRLPLPYLYSELLRRSARLGKHFGFKN